MVPFLLFHFELCFLPGQAIPNALAQSDDRTACLSDVTFGQTDDVRHISDRNGHVNRTRFTDKPLARGQRTVAHHRGTGLWKLASQSLQPLDD